ncbi:hypothetical protein EZS27_015827 [termite gut metagenome]|uniref:Uncharacterized protein n=1 Tax=termite gut metagenome TaxID=433724 RepID=A0A5J4RSA3_9ZZZZ
MFQIRILAMSVFDYWLLSASNNLNISDSLYSIFPLIRINGIIPVSRQSCKVRLLICSIRQTSLFVRIFSPFRCGVRFFSAWLTESRSSSKDVKNEAISFDFLSNISMIFLFSSAYNRPKRRVPTYPTLHRNRYLAV